MLTFVQSTVAPPRCEAHGRPWLCASHDISHVCTCVGLWVRAGELDGIWGRAHHGRCRVQVKYCLYSRAGMIESPERGHRIKHAIVGDAWSTFTHARPISVIHHAETCRTRTFKYTRVSPPIAPQESPMALGHPTS